MRRLISNADLSRYLALLNSSEGIVKYIPAAFHTKHFDFLKIDPRHADVQAINRCLAEPTHDIMTRSAKMIRGAVCMAVSEGLGGTATKALPLASSLEVLHGASLVIDDVEDQSLMRRGKPCLHLLHNEATAINAGNYMFFVALGILQESDFPPAVKFKMLQASVEEQTKLTVGQSIDINWATMQTTPSLENYLFMIQCKTSIIFRLAVRLAAYSNGACDYVYQQLIQYAEGIGSAFQITDDLINLESTEYAKGRSYLGEDITEGKRSVIIIRAVAQSSHRQRLTDILNMKTSDLGLVEEALDIIRATDALDWSRHLAEEQIEGALKSLQNCSLTSASHELLDMLGKFILTRTK
jgi:geranylgeranyl diphosphate synthase type I